MPRHPRRPPRRRGGVLRVVAVLALLLGSFAAVAPAAGAVGDPSSGAPTTSGGVREQALRVPGGAEPDGSAVALDASVFTPAPDRGRHPAVLLAHGFGASKDSEAAQAAQLAGDGYVVLTWTARGFGASGGSVHLDSPDFEVADARALVDLLATRADVQLDGVGDPRVGVAGASYGGAVGLLLSGTDPRVDAVVSAITWNDLQSALVPQAATGAGASAQGVYKQGWASRLTASLTAPAPTGSGAGGAASSSASAQQAVAAAACGRLAAALCPGYLVTARTGTEDPTLRALLTASSPARVLSAARAPVLLVQGEGDSLFGLDQSTANAAALTAAGAPVKLVWATGGHDGGFDEADVQARATVWFDRYLRRDGSPRDTRFEYAVPGAALGSADGVAHRELPAPPGIGTAASRVELPLRPATGAGTGTGTGTGTEGAGQPVLSPPGGQPAALTSLPGVGGLSALSALSAATGGGGAGGAGGAGGGGASSASSSSGTAAPGAGSLAGLAAGAPLSVLPGQVAAFTTAPLNRRITVLGSSTVGLRVTSTATGAVLFASLYDVDASGGATLPSGLVSPLRVTVPAGGSAEVAVRLPGIVRDVPAGHRLALVVASTDASFSVPADPRVYTVALTGSPSLSVPTAPASAQPVAGSGVDVPVPQVVVAAVLVVGAAGLALVTGLRRRRRERALAGQESPSGLADPSNPADPTSPAQDVPVLRVSDLSKVYGDGFRAVDDVSFTVERGQVVGLLGPNGAGKTTTLRMLLGLLRPTSGSLEVLGQRVRPGASVLGRVGALIEGPGFLPHQSGMANLRLYWQATGRPESAAHLEEALAVAGLGDAVHKKVRSYSQGMRQRLGIAQAMLGRPDLLVLDEPTNGLDPPQITAMRQVLRDYAATGRTVLVSSHLLSEVEQTCTHAVVMARGRVLAAGAVAELAAGSGEVLLGVPPEAVERARQVLTDASEHGDVGSARVVTVREEGVVVAPDPTAGPAPLVAALVGAGVPVQQVSPQRHLEEVFLSLVAAAS